MTTPDSSGNELQELTDRELLEELTATDLRLEDLHHEIRRRMQYRAAIEHRQQQHAEISRMVEHLDQAKVDWQRVRDFFRESIVESQDPWNSQR
ncbi:hypothetical protein GCM10023190_06910 [Enteractinococcus fodinae]|uniref:Uncharacterized protein n=1 Tax=Enteractinococcus fodinae TaxID=684663 RepID=A0ABU2AZQ0_9MICC|nr:hypothetical protein [Enteractinococcus fodinae]MDR7346832.1 hypothetical protein [Enteractinococcus fodinae]